MVLLTELEPALWKSERDFKSCVCPGCGAELICEEATAACLYCGNPTVIPGRFAGAFTEKNQIEKIQGVCCAVPLMMEYVHIE